MGHNHEKWQSGASQGVQQPTSCKNGIRDDQPGMVKHGGTKKVIPGQDQEYNGFGNDIYVGSKDNQHNGNKYNKQCKTKNNQHGDAKEDQQGSNDGFTNDHFGATKKDQHGIVERDQKCFPRADQQCRDKDKEQYGGCKINNCERPKYKTQFDVNKNHHGNVNNDAHKGNQLIKSGQLGIEKYLFCSNQQKKSIKKSQPQTQATRYGFSSASDICSHLLPLFEAKSGMEEVF